MPTRLQLAVANGLLVVALAGAGSAQPLACRDGHKPQQVVQLMFGRKIGPHVAVSEARWMQFLDREITPRFPDGLTVLDAAGQSRERRSGRIVREPSKIVQIVLPGKPDDLARLDAVAAAYKRSFKQQSVGIILRPACVSF